MPEKRDESFPGKYRLRRSNDFKRVFARGRRRPTRFFVIYILPNQLEFSRLGIQVRRRVGTAVVRNRIKRMVRETFRKIKDDFRKSLDLIVIAEPQMSSLRSAEFEIEFRQAIQGARA